MSLLIGQYQMSDSTICDEIIDFFKANEKNHEKGKCYSKDNLRCVDTSVKDSTDLSMPLIYFNQINCLVKYSDELLKAIEQYKKEYPGCNEHIETWGIRENVNIQHYAPGGGFKKWHSEKSGRHDLVSSARVLVFMTYLNTVTDNGGTEFLHQNLKINAEKGKTVIWPAEWTHVHRGIVSPSQEKYIITGWWSYL